MQGDESRVSSLVVTCGHIYYWLSRTLRGRYIGVPNLFGFFAPRPQQVGESNP